MGAGLELLAALPREPRSTYRKREVGQILPYVPQHHSGNPEIARPGDEYRSGAEGVLEIGVLAGADQEDSWDDAGQYHIEQGEGEERTNSSEHEDHGDGAERSAARPKYPVAPEHDGIAQDNLHITHVSRHHHSIQRETHVHNQQHSQLPRPDPVCRLEQELELVAVERMAQRVGSNIGEVIDTDERCGLKGGRVFDIEDEMAQADTEMCRGEDAHDGASEQCEHRGGGAGAAAPVEAVSECRRNEMDSGVHEYDERSDAEKACTGLRGVRMRVQAEE